MTTDPVPLSAEEEAALRRTQAPSCCTHVPRLLATLDEARAIPSGDDPEWIALANDIRSVDGDHDMGAGALAEALTARGWTRRSVSADSTAGLDVERLREAARRVPLPREVTVADIEDLAREYAALSDTSGDTVA